jgi:HAMP domain-containing protein
MNNPNMLDNVSEFVAAARHEVLEITLLSFVIALLYFLMLRLTDPSRRRHARRAPVAHGQQADDSKE